MLALSMRAHAHTQGAGGRFVGGESVGGGQKASAILPLIGHLRELGQLILTF